MSSTSPWRIILNFCFFIVRLCDCAVWVSMDFVIYFSKRSRPPGSSAGAHGRLLADGKVMDNSEKNCRLRATRSPPGWDCFRGKWQLSRFYCCLLLRSRCTVLAASRRWLAVASLLSMRTRADAISFTLVSRRARN